MPTPTREGVRARARRNLRLEVADVALDLFIRHGFDGTTVDDICAEAGISRSSFFRYFRTKEEVVLAEMAGAADEFVAALAARPDDEPLWAALEASATPLLDAYAANRDRALRASGLVREYDALASVQQQKLANWLAALTPEVSRRLGSRPAAGADPRPAAVIGALVASVDAAITSWAAAGGTHDLRGIFDEALGAVRG